jgi:hypothetical protein
MLKRMANPKKRHERFELASTSISHFPASIACPKRLPILTVACARARVELVQPARIELLHTIAPSPTRLPNYTAPRSDRASSTSCDKTCVDRRGGEQSAAVNRHSASIAQRRGAASSVGCKACSFAVSQWADRRYVDCEIARPEQNDLGSPRQEYNGEPHAARQGP